MTRIFLIRHGEPEAGWGDAEDPGLSQRGRAQAEAAGDKLAALGRLRVVSSPMQRCVETAQPLAGRLGAEPRIEPRVSEVATPKGIADRFGWLRKTFPWTDGPATLWPALDPVLWAWRADVLAAPCAWDEDCAVFTHFIAINAIVGAAMGRAETIVCRPAHASITELAIENGALRLVALGEEMGAAEVR